MSQKVLGNSTEISTSLSLTRLKLDHYLPLKHCLFSLHFYFRSTFIVGHNFCPTKQIKFFLLSLRLWVVHLCSVHTGIFLLFNRNYIPTFHFVKSLGSCHFRDDIDFLCETYPFTSKYVILHIKLVCCIIKDY